MKRAYFSVILLAGLLVLAIGSFHYIAGETEKLIAKVELIEESFAAGDYGAAAGYAAEADADWREFHRHRLFIIDNQHVGEISMALTKILTLAKEENPDLSAECAVAKMLIQIYRDKQGLDIYNIL